MKFLARNRPEWYTANEVTDYAGKFNFRTAEKELQMTLSKFTHEIRNPVALIQSELQMLASAHPELNFL